MDIHTDRESLLTVRERLTEEARKRQPSGSLNGTNGSHHTSPKNGVNGHAVAHSPAKTNGTNGHASAKTANGVHKKQSNGVYSKHRNGTYSTNGSRRKNRKKVPVAYMDLNVKEYTGKRFLDLFVGSFAMIIFLLLTPFIALGIKLSSRGPVFFTQKRTGKNGTIFTCYKFRTMETGEKGPDPETGVPDITVRGDDRIFSFGKFLRFTNLDELPQIINVFKGDMSLVGPRPYPVDECTYWNSTFDNFYYRYAVKPGITGFAQVKGFRGGTLDTSLIRKRTDYDLIYVQKNSLLFDIKTIGLTVTQMVNLRTNGH